MHPKAFTLSVIPASVVLTYFLGEDEYFNLSEVFYTDYADHWTWGDTEYALIGSAEFQYVLQRFLNDYTDIVETMEDVKKFDIAYWDIVDNCHISLGG
jgi:hypothetical protein